MGFYTEFVMSSWQYAWTWINTLGNKSPRPEFTWGSCVCLCVSQWKAIDLQTQMFLFKWDALKPAAEQGKNTTFWITIWENRLLAAPLLCKWVVTCCVCVLACVWESERGSFVCIRVCVEPFQEVSKSLYFYALLSSRAMCQIASTSIKRSFKWEPSHRADLSIYRSVFILTLADGQRLKEWDCRCNNELKWGFSGWLGSLFVLHGAKSSPIGDDLWCSFTSRGATRGSGPPVMGIGRWEEAAGQISERNAEGLQLPACPGGAGIQKQEGIRRVCLS